jgi:hypothetical protein
MLGLEFLEELLGWADSPFSYVFHALPGAFPGVGGYVQQALVGFGILKPTAAALPFTVSTTGRLLFLICFMKSPRICVTLALPGFDPSKNLLEAVR